MLVEQQTEWIINNNLINKGWCIDSKNPLKNVYFQSPKLESQKKQLKGKKPDYILYQSKTDIPIAIIEAKRGSGNLETAIEQATEYAELLSVPLIFATNGAFYESRFLENGKELILNDEEVREIIREKDALKFLKINSNEAWNIEPKVKVSREQLIKIFADVNAKLRANGVEEGRDRFREFSNILFLKLLSEKKEISYWDTIKKLPIDDILIDTINNSIFKKVEKKYGFNLLTALEINNPQILKNIIDKLDPLVLSTIDTDIKGDAFEYFLKKTTNTNNDLGQYFTPRHIITTIINLVEPKFKETVYDPFCGTGGFLTGAFNYIKDNNIIETNEDLKTLKKDTLFGGEITKNARISKMNMILHGDGHSGVRQIDSLENPDWLEKKIIKDETTGEEEEKEIPKKFNVVVTNIPFSQHLKENTTLLYNNGIAGNNGDSVCLLHCLNALKKGGRMAVIVSDGFLTDPNCSKTRKYLFENSNLKSIISLPEKVFLPYTPQKTSILYFTDAHNKTSQSDKVYFFEIKQDGYSLDRKRKKIKKNDLIKINLLKFNESDNQEIDIGVKFYFVSSKKIKETDYIFLGNKYKSFDASKVFNPYFSKIKFSEILQKTNIKKTILEPKKKYKVIGVKSYGKGLFVSKEVEGSELITKTTKFYQKIKEDCLFWCKVDTRNGAFGITKKEHSDCVASNNMCMYSINKELVNPDFLQLLFQKKEFYNFLDGLVGGSTNRRYMSFKEILNITISIPTEKEQDKLVEKVNQKKVNILRLENEIKTNINCIWNQKINKM